MEKQSTLRDFDIVAKLGEGAFGQVYKVKRKEDSNVYAMKKIKLAAMKPKQRDNALNEVRILASYNGDYIIGYKDSFYDDVSSTLCIVMELATGGDLLKMIQTHTKKRTRFEEEKIWTALVHMTQALRSLHEKKVLHRDLKGANVFVTVDGVFKLGDLNVSKVLKKDMARTQTGTPYYASPEVWKDKPYGVKSDMWSLGCVLYQMAALKPPFTATDLPGLYKKVCTGYFQRIPAVYSNDLAKVISSLLKQNPNDRPTTIQLLQNPLVHKHYTGGEIGVAIQVQEDDFLLKTLKVNHANLRSIKQILPKANYESQQQKSSRSRANSIERVYTESKETEKKSPSTEKQNQKPIQSSESSKSLKERKEKEQRLIDNYMEIKRKHEEKERLRNLQILQDQKDSLVRKRERVLSACGMRNHSAVESSPKRKRLDTEEQGAKVSMTPSVQRKENQPQVAPNSNKNLPPKPGNNASYKMPPRPSGIGISNKHNSVDYGRPGSSRQRANSKRGQVREKSKENLVRAGQNVISSNASDLLKSPKVGQSETPKNRIGRSNSAQKVVYPSWWID